MSVLQLKNVKKSFSDDHLEVLKGINLDFHLGEFVSILGESGVGKSTLMDIIGGLDSHYSGEVLINGKSLKHYKPKQLDQYRRQNIGFIFQSFHLIGHLTALGNVLVPLDMTQSKKQKFIKARELLKEVGLANQMKKYPSELSGGQKQRVSIARALASDPQILIADEPTGALDQKNTGEILKLLDQIAQSGKLVLTVTHSQRVAKYGTRIVHLANGEIDQDQSLRSSYSSNPQKDINYKSHPLRSSFLWRMTADNIKRNKGQNILTIVGSAIGLIAVLLILGLGVGGKGYMDHQILSQVKPNVAQVMWHNPNQTKSFNRSDLDRIQNVRGVKKVTYSFDTDKSQISYHGRVGKSGGLSNDGSLIKSNDLDAGSLPTQGEILVTKAVAKKLNHQHPRQIVGKTVKVVTDVPESNGQTNNSTTEHKAKTTLKVSGIFDSNNNTVTYGTTKKLLQANKFKVHPQYMVAHFGKGSMSEYNAVQKSIRRLSKNGKKLYSVGGASSTMLKQINIYVEIAVTILTVIAGISLLVAAVMIIAILYISVNERTKEIGILRALGASKKNIRHLFLDQALLLGIISSIVATILSYGSQLLIDHLTIKSQMAYKIVQIMPHQVIIIFIITLIINAIASVMPSWKASRLDPVKCLNQ